MPSIPEINSSNSATWQISGTIASLTASGAIFTTASSQTGAAVTVGTYDRPRALAPTFSVYANITDYAGADGICIGLLDGAIEDSTPTLHGGGDIIFGPSSYGLAGTVAQLSSYGDYAGLRSRATNGGTWTSHAQVGYYNLDSAPAVYRLDYTGTTTTGLFDMALYKDSTLLTSASAVPVPASMRFIVGASTGGVGGTWYVGAGSYATLPTFEIDSQLHVGTTIDGRYYYNGEVRTLPVARVTDTQQPIEILANKASTYTPWLPSDPEFPSAPPQDGFLWFDVSGAAVEAQWEGWGLHLV